MLPGRFVGRDSKIYQSCGGQQTQTYLPNGRIAPHNALAADDGAGRTYGKRLIVHDAIIVGQEPPQGKGVYAPRSGLQCDINGTSSLLSLAKPFHRSHLLLPPTRFLLSLPLPPSHAQSSLPEYRMLAGGKQSLVRTSQPRMADNLLQVAAVRERTRISATQSHAAYEECGYVHGRTGYAGVRYRNQNTERRPCAEKCCLHHRLKHSNELCAQAV